MVVFLKRLEDRILALPGVKGPTGSEGPEGPEGPAGDTTTENVTDSIMVSAGSPFELSLACPARDEMTGGGFTVNGDARINRNYPMLDGSGEGWFVSGENEGATDRIASVWAICL